MRDHRLDFWRGLCLIDMVLVHLLHEGIEFGIFKNTIVDYTRFAAGGFVFTAGLGVGLVLRRRLGTPWATESGTNTILFRRALYLLGVHYALTGSIVTFDVVSGHRPPTSDVVRLIVDIVLLREAPAYVDVLPLYAVMLLATPLVWSALRRGAWPAVVVVSAALFAYGQHHPAALSPRGIVEFPFLLWQAFFIAGLLFTAVVLRLDRGTGRWATLSATAWVAFVAMSVLAYGPRFGLLDDGVLFHFWKRPLTVGEYLRYLTATLVVVSTSAAAWRWIETSAVARFACTLGRRSLAVYVAHVFVQAVVLRIAGDWQWLGGAHAVVVLPALGSLWALARGLDLWTTAEPPWHRLRWLLRGWGAPPAGVVVAAALIAVTGPLVGPIDRGDDGGHDAVELVDEPFIDELIVGGFTAEDLSSPAVDFVEGPFGAQVPMEAEASDGMPSAPEHDFDDTSDEPLQSDVGFSAPRWA